MMKDVNFSFPFYFAVAVTIGVFFLVLGEPKEIRVVLKASSSQKVSFNYETNDSSDEGTSSLESFYLCLA